MLLWLVGLGGVGLWRQLEAKRKAAIKDPALLKPTVDGVAHVDVVGIIGPPSVGVTTQCQMLRNELGYFLLNPNELLRGAINDGSVWDTSLTLWNMQTCQPCIL